MAIMSALVWYIIPGMLGRTYDMKNETIGPDIFSIESTKDARVIERYMTTSEYRVVSEISEATDFLDVSGKLALKLKTGAIQLEGTGNYVKESSSFQKKVELLVKVHYETVVLTLPSDIKPLSEWYKMIEGTDYTHYIRSITYGGDLIASISFVVNDEADKEIIRGEIQGELNSTSGSFGGGLKGSLDKIQNKTKHSASMSINYFATVPLENVPRTIDGLTSLVDEFPEQTKQVNDGRGVPLQMEVFSLQSLDKDFSIYHQTLAFADLLTVLDEDFTDIRNARRRLSDWFKTVPPVLPEKNKNMVGEFNSKLDSISRVFSDVIGNLNLSNGAVPDQFLPAFEAYAGGESAMPNKYVRALTDLKIKVLEDTPSFEADFGGANFIYWGSDACPSSSTAMFKGKMSTINKRSIGSSRFSCLPEDRQYYPKQNAEEEEDIEDLPQIQPIAFVSGKKGGEGQRQLVKCASCRVPGKTSATMLSGQTSCPPKWTMQYQGVLVSTDLPSGRGELVCLDTSENSEEAPEDENLTVVTEVSPKCGHFPCSNGVNSDKAVPCVVCSIKKETKSIAEVFRL